MKISQTKPKKREEIFESETLKSLKQRLLHSCIQTVEKFGNFQLMDCEYLLLVLFLHDDQLTTSWSKITHLTPENVITGK